MRQYLQSFFKQFKLFVLSWIHIKLNYYLCSKYFILFYSYYGIFKKKSFKNVKDQNVTLSGCSTFNCSQICTLDSNSYPICKCKNGYSLSSDNKTCSDVNECLINNGGCSDNCTNLEGFFSCSCPIGSTLSSNYLTCEGYI